MVGLKIIKTKSSDYCVKDGEIIITSHNPISVGRDSVIQLDFSRIMPGEDGFDESALAKVIWREELGKSLLPVPVKEFEGMFYHLEGRHRLIYSKLVDKLPLCWVKESYLHELNSSDFSKIDKGIVRKENEFASRRFEFIQNYSNSGSKNYNEHFQKLQEEYPFLQSLETCKSYLHQKGLL